MIVSWHRLFTWRSNAAVVLISVGCIALFAMADGYGALAAVYFVLLAMPFLLVAAIASLILNRRYLPIRSIPNLWFKVLLIASYAAIALWAVLFLLINWLQGY